MATSKGTSAPALRRMGDYKQIYARTCKSDGSKEDAMLEAVTPACDAGRPIARRSTLKHLGWTGCVTVSLTVLAVTLLQRLALAALTPVPPFMTAVLRSKEPGVLTAALVTAGVLVFASCVMAAAEP